MRHGRNRMRSVGRGVLYVGIAFLCVISVRLERSIAEPTGGKVVHGDAEILRDGSLTEIRQSSDNAIINFNSFDIGSDEAVRFLQPDANSRALNRVLGGDATHIDGSLTANGRIHIANPQGVFFGGDAVVDVAGLTAAAGSISNEDFLQNKDLFTDVSGPVVNAGRINAELVNLVGSRVANVGTIVAPDGMVTMAAGERVYLNPRNGGMMVELDGRGGSGEEDAHAVSNEGTIDTGGKGQVRLGAADAYSLAIKQEGEVRGGEVAMRGEGGEVAHTGTTDVSSDGGRGGVVRILGEEVALYEESFIDASGPAGGGQINVGGGYQGEGDLPTASTAFVGGDSVLRADATENGDGGRVIVWGDDATFFGGLISATGGPEGGDGGFVETSGHDLHATGTVDASASEGAAGSWLLDPIDVEVRDQSSSGDGFDFGSDPHTFDGSGSSSPAIASSSTIVSSLEGGSNVEIRTDGEDVGDAGNIDVLAPISPSLENGTVSLTFTADNNFQNDEKIQAAGSDALNLVLNAQGTVTANAQLDTNGGNITSSGTDFTNSGTGLLITDGGNVDLSGHTGSVSIGAGVTTGGGSFTSGGGSFSNTASILTGGGAADIQNTGAVTIGSQIDTSGGSGAGGLTVSDPASSINLGANVTADGGDVDFGSNPVTLTDGLTVDSGDGDIIFGGTIDGSEALTLTAGAGAVDLGGDVGSGTALGSLRATGSGFNITGGDRSIDTSGGVISLTGGPISLGGNNLTLGSAGGNVTTGAVTGDGSSPADFTTNAGSGNATIGAIGSTGGNSGVLSVDITGNGGIVANGPIITAGDQGGSGDGDISLSSSSGTIQLSGDLDTTNDGSGDDAGSANLSGSTVLNSDVTIRTGSAGGTDQGITIDSALDADTAGTEALTLEAGDGAINLNAALGSTDALGGLTARGSTIASDSSGTIDVNGGILLEASTTGSEAIDLDAAVTQAGSGSVTFNSLADGTPIEVGGTGDGSAVSIGSTTLGNLQEGFDQIVFGSDGQSGTVTVAGAVSWLDSLHLNANQGNVSVNAAVDTTSSTDAAGVTVDGSGSTTTLSSDINTDGGDVTINDSVLVDGTRTIDTESGNDEAAGAVTVTGTIDGNSGNSDTLTVNTTGSSDAAVDLRGDYGTSTSGDLTVTGGQIDLAQVTVDSGPIDITGSSGINLNGATYQTTSSGAITLDGAVTLGTDVTVQTPGTDGITITGAVEGAQSLTLTASGQTIDLRSAIGGSTPLTALDVTDANTVNLPSVTTQGTAVTNTINLGSSSSIGAINLAADATLATDGAGSGADTGGIRLDGPVTTDGTNTLVTNDAGFGGSASAGSNGDITLLGNVSATTTADDGLRADAGAGNITADTITINEHDHVDLRSTGTLDLPAITANAGDNAATAGTAINLGGSGAMVNLNGDLTVNGGGTAAGNIDVTGGVVLAGGDRTFSTDSANTGNITIDGTVGGDGVADRRLTLNTVGGSSSVEITGAVGGNTPLEAFDIVDGSSVTLDAVTTTGDAVTNTINLGSGSTLGGLTLTGDLRTDGAGAGTNTGNIRVDASGAVQLQADGSGTAGSILMRTNDGGAGTDGTISFAGGVNVASADSFEDGLRMDVGENGLDVSSDTFTDLDHLVINTEGANTATLGSVTVGDGAGNSGVGLRVDSQSISLNGSPLETTGDPTNNAGDIELAGDATLGTTVTMDTDASGADGDVTFTGSVEATSKGTEGLTVSAGDGSFTARDELGAGSLTRLGNLTVTAGSATIDNEIATEGGNVDLSGITGTIDVTGNDGGDFTVDTEDGMDDGTDDAGNITFDTGVTLAADGIDVTLDARSGDDTDGDVTLPGTLDALNVDVDGSAVTAGNITSGVGGGTGAIDLNASGTGTAITFSGGLIDSTNGVDGDAAGSINLTVGSGTMELNNGGSAVTIRSGAASPTDIADANITINAAVDASGNEPLSLAAHSGDVDINAALGGGGALGLLEIEGGAVTVDSDVTAAGIRVTGNTSIDIDGAATLDLQGVDSYLESGSIDNTGGGTITDGTGGSATLALRPPVPGDGLAIGDGAGSTDVTDAAVTAADSTIGRIEIGHDPTQPDAGGEQHGTLTVRGGGGTLTANTDLVLQADQAAVSITDNIDVSANSSNLTLNSGDDGNATTITNTLSLITDGGGTIAINDDVSVADTQTLTLDSDTGDDGVGGAIDVTGDIQGDGGGNDALTVHAGDGAVTLGTDGTNVINGTAGDGRFGDVTVDTAGAVTVHSDVTATQLLVGTTDVPSSVALNSPIDLDNGGAGDILNVTSSSITFADGATVTTADSGNVLLSPSGGSPSLDIGDNADFDLAGSFSATSFGVNNTAGGDITADGGIDFSSSDIELTQSVRFDTSGGGSNVDLMGVDSTGGTPFDLTIAAGDGGNVTVAGRIGGVNRLGQLDITQANTVSLNDGNTQNVGSLLVGETTGAADTFSASGDIDANNGPVRIITDATSNDPGINVQAISTAGGDVELAANDDINIGGSISSSGGGDLTVRTQNGSTALSLGDGDALGAGGAGSGVQLSNTAVGNLAGGGFDNVFIGENENANVAFDDGATGTFDFNAPLTVDADGGASNTVTINTGLSTTNSVGNAITLAGSGSTSVTLGADLTTDGGDITATGDGTITVQLGADVTLDTDQGGGSDAGAVDLGDASVSGDVAGRDLTIDTTAATTGGRVTLGAFDDATGSHVRQLDVDTFGSSEANTGDVLVTEDITLAGSGGTSARFTVNQDFPNAGANNLFADVIVGTTIDLSSSTDGLAGGTFDVGDSDIVPAASGSTLTINTSWDGTDNNNAANAGGDVTFGAITDNSSGEYFDSVTIDMSTNDSAASAGTLSFGRSAPVIEVDGGVGAGNQDSATVTVDGNVTLPSGGSLTIDTNAGSTAGLNSGAIDIRNTITDGDADLTLTTSGFDGSVQSADAGNVRIGDLGTSTRLNLLTVDTRGTANAGTLFIHDSDGSSTAEVLTDDASTGGTIDLASASTIDLQADTLLDTESSGDDTAGALDLSASTVSSSAGNFDLAINTEGTTDGNVTLGTMDGSLGNFLNTLTVDASSAADNGGAVTFTSGNAVTVIGGVDVDASNTIDVLGDVTADQDAAGAEDLSLIATNDLTQATGTTLDANTGAAEIISNQGAVQVTDVRSSGSNQLAGASMNAGSVVITIQADGDVTMPNTGSANVQSTGSMVSGDVEVVSSSGDILLGDVQADTGVSAVFLQADNGSILDNNGDSDADNVTALALDARAQSHVGEVHDDNVLIDPEDTGYSGNALETQITQLDARATETDSEIAIDNTDLGTGLIINTLEVGGANPASAWVRNSADLDVSALGITAGNHDSDRLGFIADSGDLTVQGTGTPLSVGTAGALKLEAASGDVMPSGGGDLDVTAQEFVLKSGAGETVSTDVGRIDAAVFGTDNDLVVNETDGLTAVNLDGDDDTISSADISLHADDTVELSTNGTTVLEHRIETDSVGDGTGSLAGGDVAVDVDGTGSDLRTSLATDARIEAAGSISLDVEDGDVHLAGDQAGTSFQGLTMNANGGNIDAVISAAGSERTITVGDGSNGDVALTAEGDVLVDNRPSDNDPMFVDGPIRVASDASIDANNAAAPNSNTGTLNISGDVVIAGTVTVDESRTATFNAAASDIIIGSTGITGSGTLTLDPGDPSLFDVIVRDGGTIEVNASSSQVGDLLVQNALNFEMQGTNSSVRVDGGVDIGEGTLGADAGSVHGDIRLTNITIDRDGDGDGSGGDTGVFVHTTGDEAGQAGAGIGGGPVTGVIELAGTIDANSSFGSGVTNDVTIRADVDDIIDAGEARIDAADVLTLAAANGIGYDSDADTTDAIEIDARDITADTDGPGRINLINTPSGDATISSMTIGGAADPANVIQYEQQGRNLTVAGEVDVNGGVQSGGGGLTIDPPMDVFINAPVGGGDTVVEASRDITIDSDDGGKVDSNGGTIDLLAGRDVNFVDFDNDNFVVSDGGDISVGADAVVLAGTQDGDGEVNFVAGGNALGEAIVYSGDPTNGTVDAGDIEVLGENANLENNAASAFPSGSGANGDITVTAGRTAGSTGQVTVGGGSADEDTPELVGDVLSITANGGGIGAAGSPVEFIAFQRTDASAEGDVFLSTVDTDGDPGAVSLAETFRVGLIDANGNNGTLTSDADFVDADGSDNSDIVNADTLALNAVNGIGTQGVDGSIEFDASTVDNTVNAQTRGVFLNSTGTGGLTVAGITEQAGGGIELLANEAVTVQADSLDTSGAGGDVTVRVADADLTVQDGGLDSVGSAGTDDTATVQTVNSGDISLGTMDNADLDTLTVGSDQVGTTTLNGDLTNAADGLQTFNNDVNLAASVELTSGQVTFNEDVTGGGNDLTVTADAAIGDAADDAVSGVGSLTVSGASTISAGSVATNATQTYQGDVTLGSDVTFTGTTVAFDGDLSGGANDATVSGNAVFGDATDDGDAVSGVEDLLVTGATTINADAVSTNSGQTYAGAATVARETTLSGVDLEFQAPVNGSADLTLAASGATTFQDTVGNIGGGLGDSLGPALVVHSTGETEFQDTVELETGMAQADTAGRITFRENVTIAGTGNADTNLQGDVTLDGLVFTSNDPNDSVTFGNAQDDTLRLSGGPVTIAGAQDLTVNARVEGGEDLTLDVDGTTTVNGTVGLNDAIGDGTGAALTVNSVGPTTFNGSVATASGVQQDGGAGRVTFADTVDIAAGDTATTLNADVELAGAEFGSAGAVTFGSDAADTLTVSGDSRIDTAAAGTPVTVESATALNADLTVEAGSAQITFNGPIDGGSVLTLNTSGTTALNGAIGGTTPVQQLVTDEDGVTRFAGGTLSLDGPTSTIGDDLLLDANATVTQAGAGDVEFAGRVDSASGSNVTLSVTTAGGDAVFGDDVGTGATPGGEFTGLGALTTDSTGGGVARVEAETIRTAGDQTYNNAVVLADGPTRQLSSDGGGATGTITFNGPVDADTAANPSSLLLQVGGGSVVANAAIGGTTPLNDLTINGDVSDGTAELNAGGTAVTTRGVQDYGVTVVLGADTTLSGDTAAQVGGDITFRDTVVTDGTARSLTVNTVDDSGTTFLADVGTDAGLGGNRRLSRLETNADGTTVLGGSGAVAVEAEGASVEFNDPLLIADDTTISEFGPGDVAFNAAVDSTGGNHALAVTTADGNTVFGGTVGLGDAGGVELSDLQTDATGAGVTEINGGAVATTGDQDYLNPATLGGDTELTGANVTFGDTLDEGAGAASSNLEVEVANTGQLTFEDAVGSGAALSSLTVAAPGQTVVNGGSVTTADDQTYDSDVLLGDDTAFESQDGDVTFNGLVDAADNGSTGSDFGLWVRTANGDNTFNDAVGSGMQAGADGDGVEFLITDDQGVGGTDFLGADVTAVSGGTANQQGVIVNAPVRLTAAAQIAETGGTGIAFNNTLNTDGAAEHDLTLDAGANGDIDFAGEVGGTARPGAVQIANADNVTADAAFSAVSLTQTQGTGDTTFAGPISTVGSDDTAGGDVTITGIGGDVALNGPIATTGGADADAGDVTLESTGGDVTVTGTITATGGAADDDSDGNAGGTVDIEAASGNVTVARIETSGSGAVGGGDGDGGDAGNVTLQPNAGTSDGPLGSDDQRPDGVLVLNGDIHAMGGSGAGTGDAGSGGDVELSPAGRTEIPSVATIEGPSVDGMAGGGDVTINAGTLTMGQHEKLTVQGDFTFNAQNSTATLSDINTLGDTTILADDIELLDRTPGFVAVDTDDDGTADVLRRDLGLDFVAGGVHDFSTRPMEVNGGRGVTTFGNPDGQGDVNGTLGAYPYRAMGPVTMDEFARVDGDAPDLRTRGPSRTNIAEALLRDEPFPTDREAFRRILETELSDRQRNDLAELGVFARELTEAEWDSRLRRQALYEDFFAELGALAGGVEVAFPRIGYREAARVLEAAREIVIPAGRRQKLRRVFHQAHQGYLEQRGDGGFEADAFAEYLNASEGEAAKLAKQLSRFLDRLSLLNLSPPERLAAERAVLQKVRPEGLNAAQLGAVLDALSTRSGSVDASGQ